MKVTHSVPVKPRILMVDDHPIVCEAMAQFLNPRDDLHLCCQAANADDALLAMQSCLHDLCIVDLSLNGSSGLELIATLRSRYPNVLILTLSMHDESVYAERALNAGANGYLMKQESTRNILEAIDRILAGQVYLSDAMQSSIAHRVLVSGSNRATSAPRISERESEVLHLLGLGFSTLEIAQIQNRSIKTIETQLASLKTKLRIKTGRDLIRHAIQIEETR